MKLLLCIFGIALSGAVLNGVTVSYPRLVKRYHLQMTHKQTWYKALHFCSSRGMRLASMKNREENGRLVKQIRDANAVGNFWISGTNLGDKPHFYWMGQDKALHFTNWNDNEPSGANGEENCIELRKQFDYKWNDNRCDHKFHFVCEEQTLHSDFPGSQSLHDVFNLSGN